MSGKNDEEFDKTSCTHENIRSIESSDYFIGFNSLFENCIPEITKSNLEKPESCCYNKLLSMDIALKNMHKRWSMFD
jgi:hypothetical protein